MASRPGRVQQVSTEPVAVPAYRRRASLRGSGGRRKRVPARCRSLMALLMRCHSHAHHFVGKSGVAPGNDPPRRQWRPSGPASGRADQALLF